MWICPPFPKKKKKARRVGGSETEFRREPCAWVEALTSRKNLSSQKMQPDECRQWRRELGFWCLAVRLGGADESRRALIQQHLYTSWGLKTGLVLKWWGRKV